MTSFYCAFASLRLCASNTFLDGVVQNSPPSPLLKQDYTYEYDTAKERGENIVRKIYSRKLAEISGENILTRK